MKRIFSLIVLVALMSCFLTSCFPPRENRGNGGGNNGGGSGQSENHSGGGRRGN